MMYESNTIDLLTKMKEKVISMPVNPSYCGNVDELKKFVEGFEDCQAQVLRLIDSTIENSQKKLNSSSLYEGHTDQLGLMPAT